MPGGSLIAYTPCVTVAGQNDLINSSPPSFPRFLPASAAFYSASRCNYYDYLLLRPFISVNFSSVRFVSVCLRVGFIFFWSLAVGNLMAAQPIANISQIAFHNFAFCYGPAKSFSSQLDAHFPSKASRWLSLLSQIKRLSRRRKFLPSHLKRQQIGSLNHRCRWEFESTASL